MPLEKYVDALISKGVMPGISILVGRRHDILYQQQFGYQALQPEREGIHQDTIYDLASLTKPLVTAWLTMLLVERGEIELEQPVRRYLKRIAQPYTVQELLTHSSGLPAWFPFYLYAEDFYDQLARLPLQAKPGKKVIYSCVGYMVLGRLIESITTRPLAEFALAELFQPLAVGDAYLQVPAEKLPRTAPTEFGNHYERSLGGVRHKEAAAAFPWRTTVIRGQTHDVNSFYAGGTAGNAGLFASAAATWRLASEFFPGMATLLRSSSLPLFWTKLTPGKMSQRSIGFKLNSSLLTSGGRALSPRAIGHNGFTGTSLWLEPETETAFILLTNRVHPRVRSGGFDNIRRKLHALLKKELLIY